MDRPTTIRLWTVGSDLDGEHPPPLRMSIRPREMVSQSMFLYGVFEISETRLVQAFLGPGMTFVDVGANIGYYSLIASQLVGPTGQVHAFEPNERMRTALEENLALNGLPGGADARPHSSPERPAKRKSASRASRSILSPGPFRAGPSTW